MKYELSTISVLLIALLLCVLPTGTSAQGGNATQNATLAAKIATYAQASGWYTMLAGDMSVAWGMDTTVTPNVMYYSINCTGQQYCAVGWSPKDMDGPMVVCYYPNGPVGANSGCWDYDGQGYDVEDPARKRTTVHTVTQAAGSSRVDIVFSLDVSDLGVAPKKEIRVIYAKGPMEAEDGGQEPDTHGMSTDDMWVTWEDTYAYTMRPHKVDLRMTWLGFIISAIIIAVLWLIGCVCNYAGLVLSPKGTIIMQCVYGFIFFCLFLLVTFMSYADYVRDAALEPFARAIGQGAIFCFGLILLPVAKHASFFRLWGVSYERTLIYHIVLGFFIFGVVTLHLILMYSAYGDMGWILGWGKNMIQPNLPGVLSWVCLTIMGLTSLPPVRRYFFTVFRLTHFLFIPVIVFGIFHVNSMGYVMIIGCSLWVIDVILRFVSQVKAKPEVESCSYEPNGEIITIIVLCKGGMKYEAGQYVFLQFNGVGPLAHPFTIADYNEETKKATFYIKVLGPFTKNLADAVQEHDKKPLKLLLWQGPYGSLQVPLEKVDTVLLCSGGIGVTPMLSLLTAISRKEEGGGHVKKVVFVWSVRDLGLVESCTPLIKAAKARFSEPDRILDLRIHCTSQKVNTSMMESTAEPKFPFEVLGGRPDIDAIAKEAKAEDGKSSVGLYCCGPAALMRSVMMAAMNNGCYLHQETFEF